MPARHRYKCLNPNCFIVMFVAMNDHIMECPKCSSRKVADGGETTFDEGYTQSSSVAFHSSDSAVKQSDANLRRIADKFGLTNMDNSGGQAVKRAAPTPAAQPNEPTVSVGGVAVPVSQAQSGACINLPELAQKLPTATGARTPNKSAMLKQMTNVRAEHKA